MVKNDVHLLGRKKHQTRGLLLRLPNPLRRILHPQPLPRRHQRLLHQRTTKGKEHRLQTRVKGGKGSQDNVKPGLA